MSLIGDLQAYQLDFARQTGIELQGESTTIVLKARNQTTGAIDSTVATLTNSASWNKRRVKTALGEFLEVFHVAEGEITNSQADSVVLVTHGSNNFKVKLAAKPNGFDRYYVFEIQPV